MDWLAALHQRLGSARGGDERDAVVRVTVAAVRGSAPREPGACMLVSDGWEYGTIGGGHLELMATGIALNLLHDHSAAPSRLDRFALGATLGQCCGGIVEIWFERFTAAELAFVEQALAAQQQGLPLVLATLIAPKPGARHSLVFADSASANPAVATLLRKDGGAERAFLQRAATGSISGAGDMTDVLYERIDLQRTPLWLFGAGHVGKALTRVFADLPFELTWVDSREAMFPLQIPDNVRVLQSDVPAELVSEAPPDAMFLVLTHSHEMDYEICRAILERGDFAWAGLIGSKAKAARFVHRLRHRGFSSECVTRLTCPIGIGGVASKLPAVIAIAVAAQVLQAVEALQATRFQSDAMTQAK